LKQVVVKNTSWVEWGGFVTLPTHPQGSAANWASHYEGHTLTLLEKSSKREIKPKVKIITLFTSHQNSTLGYKALVRAKQTPLSHFAFHLVI